MEGREGRNEVSVCSRISEIIEAVIICIARILRVRMRIGFVSSPSQSEMKRSVISLSCGSSPVGKV
jgi:hypothetical protein